MDSSRGGLQAAERLAIGEDFAAFFEATYQRAYQAMWLVTRDRHEAEEALQDAYARLWERREKLGGVEDPLAYVIQTAINVFRQRRRRATRALRRTLHLVPGTAQQDQVESHDQILKLLDSLTPAQRAAVVLVDVLDLSSEQAAAVLGKKASTVRVHLARAHETLRKVIPHE